MECTYASFERKEAGKKFNFKIAFFLAVKPGVDVVITIFYKILPIFGDKIGVLKILTSVPCCIILKDQNGFSSHKITFNCTKRDPKLGISIRNIHEFLNLAEL
jgi:hypothetical protein